MQQEIEVIGSGHVVLPDGRGIPGQYANCRVFVDEDAQVLRVEPLTPVQEQDSTPTQEQPFDVQNEHIEVNNS